MGLQVSPHIQNVDAFVLKSGICFKKLLITQVGYILSTCFNERWKIFVSGSKIFIFPLKITLLQVLLPSKPKDIITLLGFCLRHTAWAIGKGILTLLTQLPEETNI